MDAPVHDFTLDAIQETIGDRVVKDLKNFTASYNRQIAKRDELTFLINALTVRCSPLLSLSYTVLLLSVSYTIPPRVPKSRYCRRSSTQRPTPSQPSKTDTSRQSRHLKSRINFSFESELHWDLLGAATVLVVCL